MKILVTGGLGFIGSNFIRYMLAKYSAYQIVNLDKVTYAGNFENLAGIDKDPRYQFFKGDIADSKLVNSLISVQKPDAIINFAAETHVDRSIMNPGDFINTDVFGTHILLNAVKDHNVKRYIQISTDEVYGDFDNGGFAKETSPLRPSSPYAASKAGGDLQVLAFRRTYNLPVLITRCTNNYGPYQYPEKIIPLFITNLLESKTIPVYGDGQQIRDWLHVDDHCSAIDLVLHKGVDGEIYNIGANQNPEITNLELTKRIITACGKDERSIEYVKDRAGHDRRYAVDVAKIKTELGWEPKYNFDSGIAQTISWYKNNLEWWKKIKTGEYLNYYKQQYVQR
ncbi:MAG: dTDP-glucose 4,6-dehydratase [Patescibacteria group bacterium]|nr:dTDP-glucose 4,6-dehydratase [Patescibacteria group bacterium]